MKQIHKADICSGAQQTSGGWNGNFGNISMLGVEGKILVSILH